MSRPFQHGRFYADAEDNTLSSNHYFSVIPAQHNFDFSKMVPNDALNIFNLNGLENRIKKNPQPGLVISQVLFILCTVSSDRTLTSKETSLYL
jgi:hypothetical protein